MAGSLRPFFLPRHWIRNEDVRSKRSGLRVLRRQEEHWGTFGRWPNSDMAVDGCLQVFGANIFLGCCLRIG